MRQTEETARRICTLDLRATGTPEKDIPALVDRFWPVLAIEIRQGIVADGWAIPAEEMERLTREYRALLNRR